jgi:hypothetical protein
LEQCAVVASRYLAGREENLANVLCTQTDPKSGVAQYLIGEFCNEKKRLDWTSARWLNSLTIDQKTLVQEHLRLRQILIEKLKKKYPLWSGPKSEAVKRAANSQRSTLTFPLADTCRHEPTISQLAVPRPINVLPNLFPSLPLNNGVTFPHTFQYQSGSSTVPASTIEGRRESESANYISRSFDCEQSLLSQPSLAILSNETARWASSNCGVTPLVSHAKGSLTASYDDRQSDLRNSLSNSAVFLEPSHVASLNMHEGAPHLGVLQRTERNALGNFLMKGIPELAITALPPGDPLLMAVLTMLEKSPLMNPTSTPRDQIGQNNGPTLSTQVQPRPYLSATVYNASPARQDRLTTMPPPTSLNSNSGQLGTDPNLDYSQQTQPGNFQPFDSTFYN